MALAPRLDLRQSQSLVMTPQLQQAIKLLALSSLEIEAFIAEEVERNPLLDAGGSDSISHTPLDELTSATIVESNERGSDEILGNDSHAASDALDVDFSAETFHHDAPSDSLGGADGILSLSGNAMSSSGFDGDGPDFESFAARDVNLREHLMAQAGTSLSGRQLFLVQQIIEHIEPTGYVGEDLLAMAQRLGVHLVEAEAALTELQRFDPTGVGARNLAECLALQDIGGVAEQRRIAAEFVDQKTVNLTSFKRIEQMHGAGQGSKDLSHVPVHFPPPKVGYNHCHGCTNEHPDLADARCCARR